MSDSVIYPWQEVVWSSLTQRFPNTGHGLLFYGKSGSGVDVFAHAFLAWVLCHEREKQRFACGQCTSCQWLKSDTHPNFVHISTDEDNKKANAKIKIEKIRDLLPFIQQTVEGWRIVLIEPAEALNIASANALLKTLEEPGEQVIIILLAEHYLKLPATIRSRMQHFALDRIHPEEASAYLQQHLDTQYQEQTELLLNLANQMPLRAVEISQLEWIQQRHMFMADWLKLVQQKNMPLSLSTKWQKSLNYAEFLMMFEYLLSDVIRLKMSQKTLNIDLDFHEIDTQYSLEELFTIYEGLQQSKRYTEQNVQTNLVLDELFIQLMNVH